MNRQLVEDHLDFVAHCDRMKARADVMLFTGAGVLLLALLAVFS